MQAQPIASISNELLVKLRTVFRPLDIKPTTEINEIMFQAGCEEVLKYLEQHKHQSEMLGDINATRMLR